MKKIKSGLIIFLCLLTVFSACFVSCGDNGDGKETSDETSEIDISEIGYAVPDKKYNGETITVLCPQGDSEWSCDDFYEETSSDEPIPNAVFERKTKIESLFGVKIKVVEDVAMADINQLVMKTHDAGLIEYDIIMTAAPYAYDLAQGGYLMELSQMGDYLDFSNDAWDQSFLEQTSIGDSSFFATGDITTMDNDGTWVMMFNKKLAAENDISPAKIYKAVTDGKWTLDKFYEYTSNFYSDLDSDGQISSGDKFGIATTKDVISGLFFGAGGRYFSKNEEDLPVLNFNNESNINLVNKIIEIYYKSNKVTFDCHDYIEQNSAAHLLSQAMFEEDRALFYSEVMQCAIRLREMETEFGIIPMPKWNSQQENYTTHVVRGVTLVACFSKLLENNNDRCDMVSMVTQALAVEGKNILTPAYYEKSLMYKGARDDESRAMLPIIFANRVYDLGYVIDGHASAMHNGLVLMVVGGSNTVASLDKRNGARVVSAMNEIVEKFEAQS